MEIEHILSSCFIKSRAPPTESERRACMARALAGQEQHNNYLSDVYIDHRQSIALERIGYGALFYEGTNYITRQEAEAIIAGLRKQIPSIKNKQIQKKIIGLTNIILSTFGPSFAKRNGGFL